MYCNQCGAVISIIDKFCPICGAPAPSINERLLNNQHQNIISTRKKKRSSFLKKLTLFVFIFTCIGALAFTLLQKNYFSHPFSTQKTSKKHPKKTTKSETQIIDQISESLDDINLLPSLNIEESKAKKACENMLLETNKNRTISFPYKKPSELVIKQKSKTRWQINGFFAEEKKNKKIKKHYSCQVIITEDKKKQPKIQAAVIIN